MAIKSTTNNTQEKKRAYPYLGEYRSDNGDFYQIVLFIAPNTGVLVSSSSKLNPNYDLYHTTWAETLYWHYTGEVTLSND